MDWSKKGDIQIGQPQKQYWSVDGSEDRQKTWDQKEQNRLVQGDRGDQMVLDILSRRVPRKEEGTEEERIQGPTLDWLTNRVSVWERTEKVNIQQDARKITPDDGRR
jgi:hypothetical protein